MPEKTISSETITCKRPRRYLVNVDTINTHQLFTDCLVIGAGIAGLRSAIEAAQNRTVTLICKNGLEDSNTWQAQGGIASVLEKTDSFESHIKDTLKAGANLNDVETVEMVVKQGPELIRQLQQWGTEFDTKDEKILTTLEGGHSSPRVIHAHGDETGKVIIQTLIRKVKENPNIRILENFFTIDLLTDDENKCVGIIGSKDSNPQIIWAANTILATGGAGRLYRETTNPSGSTADGLAMGYRAGTELCDLEFMQFHPTTLYVAGASRALITETLRGEGAVLKDCNNKAFMKEYHPDAELAPRDIVSRAILNQMLKTSSTHVYLDIRHFDKEKFKKRFPKITELCETFDIDINREMIPVRPSAHYMIGGIKTDENAGTSVKNLYAAGEVASTGLHGANRLGSNSLLEGLVFGKIAGQNASEQIPKQTSHISHPLIKFEIPESNRTRLDVADVTNSLRALMWRNVGITRRRQPLTEAGEIIRFWKRYVMDKIFSTPEAWQCQNMLTVSELIAHAANKREESRGVHFRQDYPNPDDKKYRKHFIIKKSEQ